jgi:hypothetical protein
MIGSEKLMKNIHGEVLDGIVLDGLVVICGNYGSGKSEVSVNLAAEKSLCGQKVRLADLDLVNPYFRSREAKAVLESLGVEVILPDMKYFHADLPILSRSVGGMIKGGASLNILDVGGDDVGARVLSSLADAFSGKSVSVLQVVNPNRPQTASISGVMRIRHGIEAASRLKLTGWIGNANLIDETSVETVLEGYGFLRELSQESGLPVAFITAPESLRDHPGLRRIDAPILFIRRQLVPPWKASARIGVGLRPLFSEKG